MTGAWMLGCAALEGPPDPDPSCSSPPLGAKVMRQPLEEVPGGRKEEAQCSSLLRSLPRGNEMKSKPSHAVTPSHSVSQSHGHQRCPPRTEFAREAGRLFSVLIVQSLRFSRWFRPFSRALLPSGQVWAPVCFCSPALGRNAAHSLHPVSALIRKE